MKCPLCNSFIVLESYIPVYKNGKIIKLRKFVECINGHRSEVKIRKRKETKNGNSRKR